MSDEVRTENEDTIREEAASAAEILQLMLKTSRAFRMYLPNNPLLRKFVEETCQKIDQHIAEHGDFQLDVDQFELRYRGVKIHENRDPKESIAFRMFSDGIRSISFTEGIEESEICDVLEVLGRDRPGENSDDDIVTLLWLKDLTHVSYVLADDLLDSDVERVTFASPHSQFESIRKIYDDTPLETPLQVPRQVLELTDAEKEELLRTLESEEKHNPLFEVMTIVSSILAGEEETGLVVDFLGIMDNLISNLIHSGQMKQAMRLIRLLRKMENTEHFSREKRGLIKERGGASIAGDTVLAILPIIEKTDVPAEDVTDFLHFVGTRQLGAACELLGQVQTMKMRRAVLAALVQIGRISPESFLPFLADQRWYLVRNIIFILGNIDFPGAVDGIMRVATHPDQRVRKEVLNYLQKVQQPRARMGIVRFLQDESLQLRVRALQILASDKFPPALKAVEAMIAAKDFAEKDLQEKVAIYAALGDLGGDGILPRLKEMMKKRFLLGRAKEKDSVICAVAALRKIRTPAAMRLLQEAEQERRGTEIGTFLAQTIKQLVQGQREPGGEANGS